MLEHSKQIDSNFGLGQKHSAGDYSGGKLMLLRRYRSFIDSMSRREGALGLLLIMAFYLVISNKLIKSNT